MYIDIYIYILPISCGFYARRQKEAAQVMRKSEMSWRNRVKGIRIGIVMEITDGQGIVFVE